MLQKNIDKQKRKERKTWVGYTTKYTTTKKGKMRKAERKHKGTLLD
jgi:hypothetical protein